jgi:hypothetical protein
MTRLTIFILCFLLALSCVSAVNIGVSPGTAHFKKMLKGGYASRVVTITTSLEQPLTAHYEVYGEVEDWVDIETNSSSFVLSRDEPYRMKIMMRPPSDVANGNYTGAIRIVTDHLGSLGGGTGSVVRAAVTVQLRVEITGEQILACRSGGFSIPSVEIGFPLELSYTIINDGNVQLRPNIELDIWDQLQERLMHTQGLFGDLILQTEQERITRTIPVQLPIGQYWASVRVEECDVSQLLTFSVLEKGSIEDDARFISLSTKPWARVGDIVPVTALFENLGQRSVFATFKGRVTLDDQVIQVIESDELQVSPGERMNFSLFYRPRLPGQHVINGRIHYNRKLTFERGTVVNVNPAEGVTSVTGKLRLVPIMVFLVITAVIVILVAKIRKQRRRLRRSRKRMRSKI